MTFRNGQHLSGCRLSNESFTFGPAIQASNVTVGSSLKPMESNFVQANAGPDTHAGLVGLLVLNFGALATAAEHVSSSLSSTSPLYLTKQLDDGGPDNLTTGPKWTSIGQGCLIIPGKKPKLAAATLFSLLFREGVRKKNRIFYGLLPNPPPDPPPPRYGFFTDKKNYPHFFWKLNL